METAPMPMDHDREATMPVSHARPVDRQELDQTGAVEAPVSAALQVEMVVLAAAETAAVVAVEAMDNDQNEAMLETPSDR